VYSELQTGQPEFRRYPSHLDAYSNAARFPFAILGQSLREVTDRPGTITERVIADRLAKSGLCVKDHPRACFAKMKFAMPVSQAERHRSTAGGSREPRV